MDQKQDINALLLQVMAHDLLAPLTAIKWQTELLAHPKAKKEKHAAYVAQMQESTRIGISITKHAHVAGSVLVGSYAPQPNTALLSSHVRTVLSDLIPQYERHGITLELAVDDDCGERSFDPQLIGLFLWSLAKYMLTCVPAQQTVSIRAIAPEHVEDAYSIVVMCATVPEAAVCVESFDAVNMRGAYDQAFVFSSLLKKVAPLVDATVHAAQQDGGIVLQANVRGAAVQ